MTEDLKVKGLKVVTGALLLSEWMDDVKGTVLHKGKAKVYINALPHILSKQIRINDEVYKADPTTATNIYRNFEELVTKLAKNDPVDLVMINQIHDHYSKNPKEWQDLYGVELTKLKE
jgi:hypothetical protein